MHHRGFNCYRVQHWRVIIMFNKYIPFGGLQLKISCPGFPSWCMSTTELWGFPLLYAISHWFSKNGFLLSWLGWLLGRGRDYRKKKSYLRDESRKKVGPKREEDCLASSRTACAAEIWQTWVKDCDQVPTTLQGRTFSPLTNPAAWIFDTILLNPFCWFPPLPSAHIHLNNACPL